MPSSRKRNKGKERKIKKEEKRGAWWRGWAVSSAGGSCNHGCVMIPPADHAVAAFMNAFFDGWRLPDSNFLIALNSTVKTNSIVWNDAEQRQLAMNLFSRMGTNMILKGVDTNKEDGGLPTMCAQAILLLECFDSKLGFHNALDCGMVKATAIANAGGERDTLKFYCKRLPCSCLRERYKHVRKTLPKMGRCFQCRQRKERSSLMTCGRCKVPFFCSEECHVANWPTHRKECGFYAHFRQCQEAAVA